MKVMQYGGVIQKRASAQLKKVIFIAVGILAAVIFALLVSSAQNAAAASVQQVSTGPLSACAVTSGKVKCWGINDYGQLGNNTKTDSSKPVAVSEAAGSALAGKFVEKVSVGSTHTCALADAAVYCWGDNSSGQLGNNTKTDSMIPVAVAVNDSAIAAQPAKCLQQVLWYCAKEQPAIAAKPASPMANKEIVDIAASEFFTCALATDGTVFCWGEGDNGRLGTNATTDSDFPKAVYTGAGSDLAGKRGVKLSKASGASMCVLAVDGTTPTSSATGSPYCWGYGINDGTAIPANDTNAVPCNKYSPTTRPSAETVVTETVIFESAKPVKVPSEALTAMNGFTYTTGLSTSGRAYYWGMYGFIATTSAFTNVHSCSVNPCRSDAGSHIRLVATASQQRNKARDNARNSNTAGGDRNKNLNSNQTAQQAAQNAARGGVSSSVSASGGNLRVGGSLTSTDSYSTSVAQHASGNNINVTSYRGVARPSGSATGANQTGGGGNNNTSCANQTHYGFNKKTVYAPTGKKEATVAPGWPQAQGGISAISGNIFDGLACAKMANGSFCDAHGTSMKEGQTGSNYAEQCRNQGAWPFTKKVCDPAPTGPQTIHTAGWLAGKTINTLDTGVSGFTCAIANGDVGCWGLNNVGQLGVGDKTNRNVPTKVTL